ncbi:hypothetical protein HY837_01295 [archaeon]|nr:hypothetical protein [archaeon]
MKRLLVILLLLFLACQPSFESEGDIMDLKAKCTSLGGNYCERNQHCKGTALDESCCAEKCDYSSIIFSQAMASEAKDICVIPGNTCSDGLCKIIAVVDEEVKNTLSTELSTWKQDIKNDLNMQVEFLSFPSNTLPYQIKSAIAEKYNEKVQGTVIIGDIPTMYYGGGYLGEVYPSDYYYVDLLGYCSDEYKKVPKEEYSETYTPAFTEDKNYFYQGDYQKDCMKSSQVYVKPFWTGRISPGSDKINTLKKYFERNHAYRIGQLKYEKFLAFYPILFTDHKEEDVSFDLDSLYTKEEKNIIPIIKDPEVEEVQGVELERLGTSAKMYLKELKKPYEFVYYDGHGWPLSHQPNINNEDIEKTMPQAMFYDINSCSVGRFTVKENIAGKYLYSGNGLVAFAATTPVLGGPPQITERYASALKNGLTFGEIQNLFIQNQPAHILGDPTLRMRNPAGKAQACLDNLILDFGKLKQGETGMVNLTIYNTGKDVLKIQQTIKELPGNYQSNFIFNFNCEGDILPGENMNCFFRANSEEKGIHDGVIYLITNDPNNKLIKIYFKGKQE